MATAFDAAVNQALDQLGDLPGALLPVLHEVQHHLGYVPKDAVPAIAEGLNLSRAEVHGVVSFYHHFRSEPAGAHVVQVCRAEACQAVGGRALEAHIKAKLDVDYGETTADGKVTLEPVYCLGNCACGPSVQVGERLHARVSAAGFDTLVSDLEAN
ncbi:MAG: formate dehydrogenase subunit gamma [Porticoccaceae bacterium]|nr:formate dehydrogenase subunit gamma [Porticoccaceae bacterium]